MADPAPPTGAGGSAGTTGSTPPGSGTGMTTTPAQPGSTTSAPPGSPQPSKPDITSAGQSTGKTGYIAPKVWSETKEGAGMANAYGSFHQAFQAQLPGLRQSIQTLAKRPIGG